MKFSNRVAIVTGAASGIGRAAAQLLAREGARVVVADINDSGGRETVASIRDEGGEATFVCVDVGEPEGVQQMVHATVESYGRLDILHNNAFWNQYGAAADLQESGWERTLRVTLTALYLGCKYAIPAMLKTGGGAIVNTASVHSLISFKRCVAYDTAKAGVLGLTRSVALDYGPEIRCNAVLPGAIYPTGAWAGTDLSALDEFTRMAPLKRLGCPEDIARAVAFLVSDDSSFITGAALVVDGGLTISCPVEQ